MSEWSPAWLDDAARDWSPRTTAPLRVRAWLLAPVAWDPYEGGISLDGPLSWAAVLRASGESPDDAFAECPRGRHIEIPLPLARRDYPGGWVWCASLAQPSPDQTSGVRKRRRRPDVELYPLRGKVPINGGAYKALDQPIMTLRATWLEWEVFGDRERITDMLSSVPSIGRDAARGLGTVDGWEVVEGDSDGCERDNHPLRALPVGYAGAARFLDYDMREVAYRPPYWRKDAREVCVVPC